MKYGSPFNRGWCDAYYHRPRDPHLWEGDTFRSARIEEKDMTEQQIEEYDLGYETNIDRKDWGEED